MVDHWWLDLPWNRCGTSLESKLLIPICWERCKKSYLDKEVQMIEGEEIYHVKLLSLL